MPRDHNLRRTCQVATAAIALLALPDTGSAQCTLSSEAAATRRSVRRATDCNYRILRNGPGVTCADATPPACSAGLVAAAVALASGPNNPPTSGVDRSALRDQLRCQRHIGRAVARFVGRKLRLLIAGHSVDEAEASARRVFDRIPQRCDVTVAQDASTVVVPAVGTPCDATVGNAGHLVDGDALRACLVPALEVGVDAVAPIAVAKPNLVIILTDDQRWDTTGLEHSADGFTPVMPEVQAELAVSGITFPNAFVSTALCCPSRSSLLRGQYAHTTGVLTNTQPLGGALNFDDSSTIATWLQSAGYHTGFFGKYLNGYNTLWTSPPPYVPPGWEEWHAFLAPKYYDFTLIENGAGYDHAANPYASGCTYNTCPGDTGPCPAPQNYATEVIENKALAFLDQTAGEPFFLYFAPYVPHAPACPAPQDVDTFSLITPWRPPNWNETDVSDKPMWVQNLCPMGANKISSIDNFRQMQLESLQAVDRAVGAIMDKLRALGVDQNTLVLFTSDNGFSWGSHCHRPKRCPYDECMRVPLFIRYPALSPLPRTEPRMGLNIDFAFTFAELAGLAPPVTEDGRSLVRVIKNTEPAWRTDFLYEQWLDADDEDNDAVPPTLAAVRTEEWKYAEYVSGETELYNLQTDPFELQNETLNSSYVDLKAELAARLRQLRPDWPPP